MSLPPTAAASLGTTANIIGNTITWTPPFTLTPGSSWSATVTAEVLASGEHTNTLEAVGQCGAGCIYDSGTDISYVTLLETFDKGPEVQTHTIGSAVVFTFAVGLSDTGGNTIYENLILTDTLPVGLGYISSVVTVTSDADGGQGGPNTSIINTPDTLPTIITPPSSNPSGEMVWDLGDLPGAVIITGVVTATVQNIACQSTGRAPDQRIGHGVHRRRQRLYLQRFRRCGHPGTDPCD